MTMSDAELGRLALELASATDLEGLGRALASATGAERWLLASVAGTQLKPIVGEPTTGGPAPLHGFEEAPADPGALCERFGELAGEDPLWLARLGGGSLVFAASVELDSKARALTESAVERLAGGSGTLFRDRALSTISHDLRGPLNVIGFAASMLRASVGEKEQELVAKIRRGARQMEGMIRDLLDLGELEAGRLELRRVDAPLATTLEHVEAAIGPIAQSSDVTLDRALNATDTVIHADPERLGRAIVLLVASACRNVPKGRVTLRSGLAEGAVYVEVEDGGKPMDAETRARLFAVSARGAEPHPRAKGLSLMLARRLVEAHGAAIEALESEGVRLRVTLEAAR